MYTEVRRINANPGIQIVVFTTPSEACREDFGRLVIDQLREASADPHGESVQEPLTPREQEVLSLMARGCDNLHIASELFISKRTVETHVSHIYSKLAVQTRCQAVLYAIRAGLV